MADNPNPPANPCTDPADYNHPNQHFARNFFRRRNEALRDHFQNRDFLDLYLQGRTVQDAMNLCFAMGYPDDDPDWNASIIRVCDLTCEDLIPHPQVNRGLLPDDPVAPVFYLPQPNAPQLCDNRATVMNNGVEELSLCVCDPDHPDHPNDDAHDFHLYPAGRGPPPGPGFHPGPYRYRLVCTTCKQRHAADFDWRRESVWLGACAACRKWVVDNLQAGESRCTCVPSENELVGSANELPATHHQIGQPYNDHLCNAHDEDFWDNVTRIQAAHGMNVRRQCGRPRAPKKRGHGWTRKKQRGVPSPQHRNNLVQAPPAAPAPNPFHTAVPKCWCGTKLKAENHHRGNGNSNRVRNCASCFGWIRNW